MNHSQLLISRRGLLGATALSQAYFLTPGLFAEEVGSRPHAAADRRAVLPEQAAARHRQRPAHRQRRHHAGRRRDHAPERAHPRRQGQPGAQRPRRNLAGATARASTSTRRTPTARTRDANFQGFGRFLTGSSGEYYFRTIKPVPYPGRTPHIHFKIKRGSKELLTTQCYIKGHAGNERDFVFRNIRDAKARESVLVDFAPVKESRIGELAARFDIILGLTPEA